MVAKILPLTCPQQIWKRRTAIFARLRLAELGASDAQADQIIARMMQLTMNMPSQLSDAEIAADFYERVVPDVAATLLEASLRYNVPHASACGGKARCSTCRIRVLGDRSGLPRPSPREVFVLDRVGAIGDPAIRLGCQLRPQRDIVLVPLLPPHADTSFRYGRRQINPGEERYIVCMFVDMRGSTAMADKRLAFDAVFIINRFLAAVSQAVTEAGGQPNQYLGDGLMALFGLKTDPPTACRQALNAAAMIAGNVDHLNRMFAEAEQKPIQFGIGIHAGDAIVGDIGYRDTVVFTALGDAVNVTARLEQLTKELNCQVVLSDIVLKTARLPPDDLPIAEVTIRGRTDPLVVRTVVDAARLASILDTYSDAGMAGPKQPEAENYVTL